MERSVSASDFKARCLALLDTVERTGQELVVTKRGRPVARIVPIDHPKDRRPLMGSVTVLVDDERLLFSAGDGEPWDAERGVLVRESERRERARRRP